MKGGCNREAGSWVVVAVFFVLDIIPSLPLWLMSKVVAKDSDRWFLERLKIPMV